MDTTATGGQDAGEYFAVRVAPGVRYVTVLVDVKRLAEERRIKAGNDRVSQRMRG